MDLPPRNADGTYDRHLCAEAWFVVPVGDGVETLLLLRHPDDGGFWQGVSGTVDREDTTWEGVVAREVFEETGLGPDTYTLLDLDTEIDFTGLMSGRPFTKRVFALRCHTELTPDDIALSEEHVEARRVTFEEAEALVRFEDHRRLLQLAREAALRG